MMQFTVNISISCLKSFLSLILKTYYIKGIIFIFFDIALMEMKKKKERKLQQSCIDVMKCRQMLTLSPNRSREGPAQINCVCV